MAREARYGGHLFEVRVHHDVDPRAVLYVGADSIVVTTAGALVLAVEVDPLEEDGDSSIEMPPALIVAPGKWFSVTQVTSKDDGHEPIFFEPS